MHSALGKKGDVIVEYVRQMKLPDWFNEGAMDEKQVSLGDTISFTSMRDNEHES